MGDIDWDVVQQAVHRAAVHYARAYFIPANDLCAGVPEYQRRMAENWAQLLAPFATDCIREDLRKTAAMSDEDLAAIDADSRFERTQDAADLGLGCPQGENQ